MLTARYPDVIAFTHCHKDHYDPGFAAAYQRQTNGVILGPADLPGCKTTQPLTQTRDSVRVEFRHDSVYIWQHDSIFRDRWRAGDTVFVTVEKFKTLYKDKLVEVHDTISTTQTEQIAVKYVPNYYRRTSTGFWILLAVLIVLVGWKVAKIYFKIQSGGIL